MNPVKKIIKYLIIGLILYLLITTIVITVIMHKKSTITYDIDVKKKMTISNLSTSQRMPLILG
ncbi:MAG: hypothetical protein SOU08_04680 [Anaerococcus sp.]|nr:hypothetical protein [Anaerococcus sp.]MDD7044308.1 hypothetical protein [Peptoniphilaceae bacterium]MDY2918918.1 hypothetical protein [Anaerococcus sp.]